MKIVAISGKRESGKSLLASFLEHNHGFERWSLADDLKRRALRDFPLLRPSQLWGNEKEIPTGYIRTDGSPLTGRDILIRMGTFYRSVDALYWCKQFDPKIGDLIVIDDLRFVNEMRYFKENHETYFVRLERDEEAIGKKALDDLSETEMDSFTGWNYRLEASLNKLPKDLEIFANRIASTI